MHLGMSKSKNSTSLYVLRSTYTNGVHSTKIVEKLGTVDEIRKKINGEDPIEWAKNYIENLNRAERRERSDANLRYSTTRRMTKNMRVSFNGGFLFLRKVFSSLNLKVICRQLQKKYALDFKLSDFLETMIYSRIIYPESTLSFESASQHFISLPELTHYQICTAIKILVENKDLIQSRLFQSTHKILGHDTSAIYYDATTCLYVPNIFSNEVSPTIPMELYYDGALTPLGYSINPLRLKATDSNPLEEELKFLFSNSSAVSLTDQGIISGATPEFKDWRIPNSYMMAVSYDRLYDEEKSSACDPDGWACSDREGTFNIKELNIDDERNHPSRFYYKDLVSTRGYSPKRTLITYSLFRHDSKRSNYETYLVEKGLLNEAYTAQSYFEDTITAYVTNLMDTPAIKLIQIAMLRHDIHRGYAMLPMEKGGQFYQLSHANQIEFHFLISYCATLVFTTLLKKIDALDRSDEVKTQLQNMNFLLVSGEGYIPLYTRNDLTDLLHETFGFNTDFHFIRLRKMELLLKGKTV